MRVLLQKITAPGKSLGEIAIEVRQSVKQLAETVTRGGLPHLQTVAYYDETLGGPIFLAMKPTTSQTPEPNNSKATAVTFKTFNNRDSKGGDLKTLKEVDINACTAACRSDPQCKAFSYDKWNRWCFLKSRASTLLLEPSSVMAIRNDVPTPDNSTTNAEMQRFKNKIFPGDGYKSVVATSYEACLPICKDDLSCVTFTFLKREERCKLFKTPNEYFSDMNAESGVKRQTTP